MKIVFVAHSRLPSTTANSLQVVKIVQAYRQLGHTVQLFASEPVGEGLPAGQNPAQLADGLAAFYALEQAGETFPVEWLPARPGLRRYDYAWRAVQRARAWGADLVYSWMPQVGLASLLSRMPLILEVHEPPTGRFGPLLFGLLLRLPGQKRFVPLTQTLAKIIRRRFPRFSPDNPDLSIAIGPDAVDLEPYAGLPGPEEARAQLGLPQKPTIGHTGHMYAGRGIGLLLELAQRFPQVNFLLVGGRPADLEMWRGKVAQAGLTNMLLTGFVERRLLPLYQAASDVLLMPYEKVVAGSSGGDNAEFCSPMKMFEYMACGRAIISSDLPAIGEVLNGQNSLLVPPEDLPAWMAALQSLLADPALRLRLGARANQDVQAYTWTARARQTIQGFPRR